MALLGLFIYVLFFLKSILNIFGRTTLETSVLLCALMCLSSVNIIRMLISLFAYALNTIFLFACIIMFYQINSLTHARP